jgi:hypothetical protein
VIVTVVLKIGSVGLHCDGCMHRIRCKLFKIKGTPSRPNLHACQVFDQMLHPCAFTSKLYRP